MASEGLVGCFRAVHGYQVRQCRSFDSGFEMEKYLATQSTINELMQTIYGTLLFLNSLTPVAFWIQ